MTLVGWIIIGFVGFIILAVGIVWAYFKFFRKRYMFLLYSKDGKHISKIEGEIRSDANNKSRKYFYFKELDTPLDIKPPSMWLDGVPYREITFNELSEYNYLLCAGIKIDEKNREKILEKNKMYKVPKYVDGMRVDDTLYKEVSLLPEEKTLALHRYKDNEARYRDPLSKLQAYQLIGTFIMLLLVILGTVYIVIQQSNTMTTILELEKEKTKNTESIKTVSKNLLLTTELQASITGALTGDKNLTRQIS